MPLYTTQVSYTSEAWAALTQNPEDRSEAFGGLAKSMGGRLLSFYNSFGERVRCVGHLRGPRREHRCGHHPGHHLPRSSQCGQDHRAAQRRRRCGGDAQGRGGGISGTGAAVVGVVAGLCFYLFTEVRGRSVLGSSRKTGFGGIMLRVERIIARLVSGLGRRKHHVHCRT
jgi:hypothetical protein